MVFDVMIFHICLSKLFQIEVNKKKNVMITVCDTRRYSYHMIV